MVRGKVIILFVITAFIQTGPALAQCWKYKSSGTTVGLVSVSFANPNVGFAAGNEGLILKTTDGGENWTMNRDAARTSLYGVSCAGESVAFAAGYQLYGITPYPSIFKTTNQGESWTGHFAPTTQQISAI